MADNRRNQKTTSSKKIVDPPTASTDGKVTPARVQQKFGTYPR